jgi:hypothetical protein
MPIGADLGLMAAAGDSLMERWRDLGTGLWLATAVMAGVWLAVLLLIAALRDPRRVQPAPALLEPQGDEPPAVVNLITTDWGLGHEAVPGTLIDLAARHHVEIDMVGDDTFVRVRRRRAGGDNDLTAYEWMVLDHVSDLAGRTEDGRVPAQALTTGPERSAKRWWKRFRSAVVDDARRRGVSQPRWPGRLKTALVVAALPIALTAALAGSTLRDDPDDPDDSPAESALACGVTTMAALGYLAVSRSGERDTSAGRAAAARWLGLRGQLAEDPLFAAQPPAAVAIWDRILAHGTALGVAHGVVQALPLGTESEREAWSSVGGRWRVVRVCYPGWLPPGYGLHPGLAMFYGLLQLVVGVPTVLFVASGVAMFAGASGDSPLGADADPRLDGALTAAGVAVTVLVGLVVLVGAWMILAGLADLVTGRTTVEGRVLRERNRYKDDKLVSRHLAVDDGTGDKVRAWKFRRYTVGGRGDEVRGRVTRYLRHVADLEVVGAGAPAAPDAAAPAVAAPVVTAAVAASTAPSAPAPPLPDDGAVSAAAGFLLARDPGARPHPAALPGGSALYRGGDAHVQVAWVPSPMIEVYRRMPGLLRRELAGVGDEAYRARWGGGVIARTGDRVVTVTPHLPGLDDARRDEVAAAIAAAALARVSVGRLAPQ